VLGTRLIDLVDRMGGGAALRIASTGRSAPGLLKILHCLDPSGDPGSFAGRYRPTATIVNGARWS
jgi:hypothetical protein